VIHALYKYSSIPFPLVSSSFKLMGQGHARRYVLHVGGLPLVRKTVLLGNSIRTEDHVTTIIEQMQMP